MDIIESLTPYVFYFILIFVGSIAWNWFSKKSDKVRNFDLTLWLVDMWKSLFWKKKIDPRE